MARSFWKGKTYLKPIFNALEQPKLGSLKKIYFMEEKKIAPLNIDKISSTIKLQRRNQTITKNLLMLLPIFTDLQIYNGYDFLKDKILSVSGDNINLASFIFTREQNVTHKQKLSKAARKTLQLKSNKKKSSVVTKGGLKAKKIIKKKK